MIHACGKIEHIAQQPIQENQTSYKKITKLIVESLNQFKTDFQKNPVLNKKIIQIQTKPTSNRIIQFFESIKQMIIKIWKLLIQSDEENRNKEELSKQYCQLFKQQNSLLINIKDFLKNIPSDEIVTKEDLLEFSKQLEMLNIACHDLLSGYDIISPNIDTLWATSYGHLKKHFNEIDAQISDLYLQTCGQQYTVEKANRQAFPPSPGKTAQDKWKFFKIDENAPKNGLEGKKIIIATCGFGTGHKITAQALSTIIGKTADVNIVDPTDVKDGIFNETDWVYRVGKFFGKQWNSTIPFNWILRNQYYWMVNLENRVDTLFRKIFNRSGKNGVIPYSGDSDTIAKQKVRHLFLMERPDFVLTSYHMHLHPFLEVCKEFNIPLLHSPTDLDVKMRELFDAKIVHYKHFKTLLPHSADFVVGSTNPLSEEHVDKQVCGMPLRPEFYQTLTAEEINKIKQERGIDPDAKVIIVLSGGNGQELPYPKMLMESEQGTEKYHMIVVAGGNNKAGDHLNALKKGERFIKGSNPNVTIEVAEDKSMTPKNDKKYYIGAQELSRLYDLADVAISKPGGLSVGELLQKGVPMILDNRVTPMPWESFNIEAVKELNRGNAYTKSDDLMEMLKKTLDLKKDPQEDNSQKIIQVMLGMIQNLKAK